MAKYGSFDYSEAKYGASSSDLLLWTFMVDWDGDGYFDGGNEASRMVDFSLSRGRERMVSGDGFNRYRTGTVTVILDNDDGRYNPYNTASPLYPHVTPGKRVRIAVKEGANNHELMRGKVADIQPYNQGNRKMVKIDVVDGQEFLAGKNLRLGYRRNGNVSSNLWTTGSWVYRILSEGGWPDDEWPIEYDLIADYNEDWGGNDQFFERMPYGWFWDIDALDAVRELEDAEIGTFLHARDGTARFLSRHFTYDQDITLDESEVLRDITIPQPWETLRNRVEVAVHPIAVHDVNTILWQIGGLDDQAIRVAAESSFVTDAIFRYFNYTGVPVDAISGVFSPAVSFTVNSNRAGTGTDLTSQCSVQLSELADGATVTLLNNSASVGYITNLQISGDIIFSKYKNIISAEDLDSQAIYDDRVLKINSPWQQDSGAAGEIAAFLLEHLKQPKPHPTVSMEHYSTVQFALDLYVDRIRLISPTLSIDRLYRIGAIEHKWLNPTGNAVRTVLRLEPWFAEGADNEYDYELLSTFASASESDCSGSAPAGLMEWCLDSPAYPASNWNRIAGGALTSHIYLSPGPNTSDAAEASADISYPIPANGALSYDYIYQDTDAFGAGTVVANLILTTNQGEVYNEPVPFVATHSGMTWVQAVVDLSPYAGQTLTNITFKKNQSFADAGEGTILRIDNVGVGVQIYP